MREWVNMTFQEVGRDKTEIQLEDFARLVELHPGIVDALAIPMNFLHPSEESAVKAITSFEKSFRSRDAVARAQSMKKISHK